MLWHRRLGHISIERMKKLDNDGVLSTLDFADFETCVNCIKGKQTNKSKRCKEEHKPIRDYTSWHLLS